jgi:hypothetical protein
LGPAHLLPGGNFQEPPMALRGTTKSENIVVVLVVVVGS